MYSVLDSASVAALAVDESGMYAYQNRAAQTLLGYEPGDLRRLHVSEVVAHSPDWVEEQFSSFKRRRTWSGQLQLRCASGDLLFIAANAFVGATATGQLTHVSLLHPVADLEARSDGPLAPGSYGDLTSQELRLLFLLAEGFADKEIATLLGVSVWSVNRYVHAILQKLKVKSRTEACVMALKKDLIV